MKRLAISTLTCFLVASACSSATTVPGDEEVLVLEIAPDSVPCTGEMVGQCLQVRSPGEDWRRFYDAIEGFVHEPGVRYTIEVGRRVVPNPPADGSAYAYRLVRILARGPTPD